MGVVRVRILTVHLKDITFAELVTFRPLRDFGGWGIKSGKDNVIAYFMSGTQGVRLVSNKGKKYVIGSDVPNLLKKVIQAKCHLEETND